MLLLFLIYRQENGGAENFQLGRHNTCLRAQRKRKATLLTSGVLIKVHQPAVWGAWVVQGVKYLTWLWFTSWSQGCEVKARQLGVCLRSFPSVPTPQAQISNKTKQQQSGEKALLCSICCFPRCKYSHPGWFQATMHHWFPQPVRASSSISPSLGENHKTFKFLNYQKMTSLVTGNFEVSGRGTHMG